MRKSFVFVLLHSRSEVSFDELLRILDFMMSERDAYTFTFIATLQ